MTSSYRDHHHHHHQQRPLQRRAADDRMASYEDSLRAEAALLDPEDEMDHGGITPGSHRGAPSRYQPRVVSPGDL